MCRRRRGSAPAAVLLHDGGRPGPLGCTAFEGFHAPDGSFLEVGDFLRPDIARVAAEATNSARRNGFGYRTP